MHDILDVTWTTNDMLFKLHMVVEKGGGGGLTILAMMSVWCGLIIDTIPVYMNFVKKFT